MSDKNYISIFDVNKIDILTVRVIKASVDSDENQIINPSDVLGYDFSWSMDNSLDLSENLARIVISFNIKAFEKDEQPLNVSGRFSIEYIYRIHNLNEFILPESQEEQPIFHSVLTSNLLAIAFSTSRGIILTRCNGTVLQGAILPIISPKSIVENDESLKSNG